MNFFENLFKPRSRTSSKLREVYKTLYPESVRYALQYNESRMGKAEMLDLLPNYTYEVTYLVAKAVAHNRRLQRQYIYDLVRLYTNPNWTENDLRDLLRRWIDSLPEHTAVSGTKLAQLNRYGSDYWRETFHELAQNIYAENPDAIPCLIAHTPLFALHHFVRIYNQKPQGKLLILVPDWLEDDSDDLMGYDITLGATPSVNFQEKDECIFGEWECYKHECPLQHQYCGNTIFVDDTINTGSTAGKLESFWHTEYGLKIPEEHIRVITDLRGRGYIKAKPKEDSR
jgi:hypothetical protein